MSFDSTTFTQNTDALASDMNNLRLDLVENAGDFNTSGGSANAYTVTVDTQISAYAAKQVYKFLANHSNTGASTLNVNAIGAESILKADGNELEAGDIRTGQIVFVLFDGTNFLMVTPSSNDGHGFFGDGSDGDVVLSTNTTLTGPMYYRNLTIQTGVTLNPGGFHIFVRDTLTYEGTGRISVSGGNAGNGTTADGAPGGAAGTRAYTASNCTLPAIPANGAGGPSAPNNATNGAPGGNGGSIAMGLSSSAAAGGTGTNGNNTSGGAPGAAGTTTNTTLLRPRSIVSWFNFLVATTAGVVAMVFPSPGPGGGGGGGNGSSGNPGSGGGAGANGGTIFVAARNIITVNGNNFAVANGGNGGNGGNGTANCGAGGAGAGGNGGWIIFFFRNLFGSGTTSVTAGTGGVGGTGGWLGADGGNGGNGTDGEVSLVRI